jgi:hypothetical protein
MFLSNVDKFSLRGISMAHCQPIRPSAPSTAPSETHLHCLEQLRTQGLDDVAETITSLIRDCQTAFILDDGFESCFDNQPLSWNGEVTYLIHSDAPFPSRPRVTRANRFHQNITTSLHWQGELEVSKHTGLVRYYRVCAIRRQEQRLL